MKDGAGGHGARPISARAAQAQVRRADSDAGFKFGRPGPLASQASAAASGAGSASAGSLLPRAHTGSRGRAEVKRCLPVRCAAVTEYTVCVPVCVTEPAARRSATCCPLAILHCTELVSGLTLAVIIALVLFCITLELSDLKRLGLCFSLNSQNYRKTLKN